MKKLFILSMLLLSFCGEDTVENEIVETTEVTEMTYDKTYTAAQEMTIDVNSKYSAELETSLGNIVIELFTETSPITVNNFVTLSNDGYYNDVIFHRVIKGFMIQGGDPSGTGHGDMGKYPGYDFEDELNNPMNYEKGIVSPINQKLDGIKYANKIHKNEAEINWELTSIEIFNKVRAFDPFPGTYTRYSSKIIKVIETSLSDITHNSEPGTIINTDQKIIIAYGNKSALEIKLLQKPGKRMISANDFLNGTKINVGEKFGH